MKIYTSCAVALNWFQCQHPLSVNVVRETEQETSKL